MIMDTEHGTASVGTQPAGIDDGAGLTPDVAVRRLRELVRAGDRPHATLLESVWHSADPAILRRAGRILGELPAGEGDADIAVCCTATAGALPAMLRTALASAGIGSTLSVREYGEFGRYLSEPAPDGAAHEIIVCLLDHRALVPQDWTGGAIDGLLGEISARVAELTRLLGTAATRRESSILVHTVPLPENLRNSVIGWSARAALSRAFYELNAALLGMAMDFPNIEVVDFANMLAAASCPASDERLRSFAEIPYTDDALLLLCNEIRRFVLARRGLARKVLALDLDNTLWGGVLGEVGVSGVQLGGLYPGRCYQELQRSARRLREQGVLLVLVSKNTDELVRRALREHPEMLLREKEFTALAVNWTAKADNIAAMATDLDLSTAAFVFMDDSPFERGGVAARLPGVAIVPADGEPAELVDSLLRQGYFDVPDLTDTDVRRPQMYQARSMRATFAEEFTDSASYLSALDITVTVCRADEYSSVRIAQLAARTNQFNLTGQRFDAAKTLTMAEDAEHLVVSCAVADRFGDEGIVGAAWVRCGQPAWQVRNLVLSCRVLGRGVEQALVSWLASRAREAGAASMDATFVPSDRNSVAAGFWTRAGFDHVGSEGETELYRCLLATSKHLVPGWIRLVEEGTPR